MTNNHDEPKTTKGKQAGSIRQYSTIGGGKPLAGSPAPQQSGSQEVQQSKEYSSPFTAHSTGKGGRKQKTIYLSPNLARRLNMFAAESEQEISEIAEQALDQYLRSLGK
jgi:hypothetical protein